MKQSYKIASSRTMALNPESAVAIYCGLKTLAARLFHDFAPQHIYEYAFAAKSLQLRVSPRFSASRYDVYCKIWVKIPAY